MRLNTQAYKWLAKALMLISMFAALPMPVAALTNAPCAMPMNQKEVTVSAISDSVVHSSAHLILDLTADSPFSNDVHCQSDDTVAASTCADQSCHCGHLFVKSVPLNLLHFAKPSNHFQASFRLQPSPPNLLYRPPQFLFFS